MPETPFDNDSPQPTPDEAENRVRWDERLAAIDGTDPQKRRHHFVPQFWLRQWADDSGQVHVIETTEQGVRAFDTSTRKIMVVTDLYEAGVALASGRDFGPEERFSVIENAAASALEAIVAGNQLSDDQRYDLALLIALQHLRTPDVIRHLVPPDAEWRDNIETIAALLVEHSDKTALESRSNAEVASELLAGVDDFIGLERGFGYWNVIHHAHDLAARIHRRSWSVAITEDLAFLGDNPVPLAPLGGTTMKAHGATHTFDTPIPLGPNQLLLIGNRPRQRANDPDPQPENWGAVNNQIQIAKMARFLIGPTE